MGFIESIKKFDAYPKTLEDFRIKTLGGGTITGRSRREIDISKYFLWIKMVFAVIAGIVMLLLFASETQDYLTPSVDEQLFVDTTRGSKLKINLDIVSFGSSSCPTDYHAQRSGDG